MLGAWVEFMRGNPMICIQKDKEPLASYVKKFIQLKSQTSDVDESIAIAACIKGPTPGPTALHLTREKPKTMDALFLG